MGSKLSVRNNTSVDQNCRVYPAGSEKDAVERLILKGETEYFSSCCSKTFIVSIEGKAVRAVSKGKVACLKEIADKEYIIVVEDPGDNIIASSADVIESREMDLNWNSIRDEGVKTEGKKAAADNLKLMAEMNKYSATVLGMMTGLLVAETTGNKDAARLATKASSDLLGSYLKTSLPQASATEDHSTISKLKDIRQTLVAVSRDSSFGYQYFIESISRNEDDQVKYLHDLLSKVTSSNIFPFLEECGLEEAIPIYLLAISVVLDLFVRIREVRKVEISEEEKIYKEVFINNLSFMWNRARENIESNCKTKVKGFCVKRAVLSYRGQLIFCLNSRLRKDANDRIDDIRKQFIISRKYQLEYIHKLPSDFMRSNQDGQEESGI